MRATQLYILAKFFLYNAQCFGGELPPIALRISHAATRLGTFSFDKRRPATSRRISISDRFDLTERELDDVIIHEMIHYYLHLKGLADATPHGPNFRAMMEKINTEHGRAVSVRTKLDGETRQTGARQRLNLIALLTLSDGTRGMAICGKGSIARLHAAFRRSPRVKQIEWYLSTHPYFSAYPLLRTPKYFALPPDLPLSDMTAINN